jgi:nitrate reductase beta subunit
VTSSEQPETSKSAEDGYVYLDPSEHRGRPGCISCGDPVKAVHHSGKPMLARHCRECFAELFHGKIPKPRGRRTF